MKKQAKDLMAQIALAQGAASWRQAVQQQAETSQQHSRSQHQGQDCPQRRRHCGAGSGFGCQHKDSLLSQKAFLLL